MTTLSSDKDLSVADVQSLSDRDSVAAFFAALGYATDTRLPQTAAAMGITTESLQRQIQHIERIAVQEDGAEPLDMYLVELDSVTVAATHGLARSLRNRIGNYLLVLTDDYDRIDFVLLERSLPATPATAMTTRQVTVRPRVLTVNRRAPTQVQLRVLRRFTYTEADSDAQYDKLLSAYSVAEWSEPLFNNRALFSDYYLNERLRERTEWHERPEEVYHRLRDLLRNARERLSGKDADHTFTELLEPTLSALGFKSARADDSNSSHHLLFTTEGRDRPVGICLAYVWNRNLDGRDETRDPDTAEDNPGARVVTLLESGEAPWAIVTNGKLWRLYSAKAHSRATNYYEIDLEENLASDDPNVAFRYFFLFFRAAAFVPRDLVRDGRTRSLTFLDELIEDSESFARALGEQLKKRVFEDIFPHFAEGFIEHLRSQPPVTGSQQETLLPVAQQLALKREPDEAFRRQVFQGTLTFLYRLIFLLYAESLGLLPVREERGYWEHSLTRMKEEIAGKAGRVVDEVPQRLRSAYRADSTTLYDRLLTLFGHIAQGNREINLPLYNGGLFITRPESADHTDESESARFLLENRIPDRYLALGLDLLARDIDEKRQDLAFIDYKSLGVRQLGSIYEGLLEFRVRIAQEKMAVVKGKKTEEVIPYAEAMRTKRSVLKTGRGRNAEERVYRPGRVYLENDRRERKATGSYYTPDHIVKYIVENTVGPVLEEKFNKLRPVFREAQQAYRRALQRADGFRKQGMKPDDPAKVANTNKPLVDELFDLRVLDPAMGSGHFLVEAVDFICDRILGQREGFLQAFPGNPVTRFLHDTRQAIMAEMERQGVTIDTGRLTDINLLKRHVLKRCIYGVDLNPMAVELAKVSLWLDCFTLGAPLSFLDHHLKCGNSLIGTTVQEVEAELAVQKKGFHGDLFGGPFQGLLASTSTMLEIARSPDATVEQAERSRGLFKDFERSQAPYKAALDIWVSRHFGNDRAHEYLTLVGRDFVEEIRSGGKGLSPPYREVIARAAALGEQKRFFHWDLEFPEAFVDLERNTWKPRERQGFDAMVGNPPWLSYSGRQRVPIEQAEIAYFATSYLSGSHGWLSTQGLFLERAANLLTEGGHSGLVVPAQVSDLNGFGRVRQHMRGKGCVHEPCPYHGEDAFAGVTEPSITVIFERQQQRAGTEPDASQWSVGDYHESPARDGGAAKQVLAALSDRLRGLGSFEDDTFGDTGVHTGNSSSELIHASRCADCWPIREGRDMGPFFLGEPRVFLRLDMKPDEYQYFRIGTFEQYARTPILVRQTASRPIAALHTNPTYFRNSVLACYGVEGIPHPAMVALLNSSLFAWLHVRANRDARHRAFPQVKVGHLRRLPKPPAHTVQKTVEVEVWLAKLEVTLKAIGTAKEEMDE